MTSLPEHPPPSDRGDNAGDPLPPDVQRLLESIAQLPDGHALAPQLRAILISRSQTQITSGGIPPPAMLREYEEILPGASDRMFKLAENQQSHRISLEAMAIPAVNGVRIEDSSSHFPWHWPGWA